MGLKNILIVVSDIERSKIFYEFFFGLHVMRDFGDNVILSEGLVLQDRASWEKLLGTDSEVGSASALFFTVENLESFLHEIREYMAESGQKINIRENSWGKRDITMKDPDGHLIEVAER